MIDPGWMILIVAAMFHLVPALMILGGIVAVSWPRAAWYARLGWQIRGAEPTTLALVTTRLGGLIGCVFGALFLTLVLSVFHGAAWPAVAPAPAAVPK